MKAAAPIRWANWATWAALLLVACSREGGAEPKGPAAGASGQDRSGLGSSGDGAVGLGTVFAAGDVAGFARALRPPDLRFPRDHGPHRDFRTEWWYWTGNLQATDGRAFGFQLVFFRQALAPPGEAGDAAALQANEVVLAHAALTDVAGAQFHFAERLVRRDQLRGGAMIDADGALQLFCADWSAVAATAGDGLHPVRLRASDPGFSFDLRLQAQKPIVLQGDRGLSQKGRQPGNASIYYSVTRLQAVGTVDVGEERLEVSGQAWLDREWSTSALEPDQVGWDWFSLQLDCGSELMWYRLRMQDGSESAHSSGILVAADGTTTRLAAGDLRAAPGGYWTAADDRARYPVRWQLTVPAAGLDLEVRARVDDQELRTLVRYWEGSVAVTGTRAGAPVAGLGYLEMTGYATAR